MGIGKQIREARKAAGLTQSELAQRVHLSRSHIGAIELDRYNPSLSTLTAIAAAVGKPIAELVDSGGIMEVYNPDNSIDVYEQTDEHHTYYHDPEVAFMLPQRLKEERNKRRLSQMEFSKIIGVSQQTIGSWETGRTSPDYEALNKLADYFGVSTDYLLGRDAAPVGTGSQTPSAAPKSGAKEADEQLSQKKEYIELHRLVDQLSHSDVEELLNTARFKKNKAERIREHVDDPDDF